MVCIHGLYSLFVFIVCIHGLYSCSVQKIKLLSCVCQWISELIFGPKEGTGSINRMYSIMSEKAYFCHNLTFFRFCVWNLDEICRNNFISPLIRPRHRRSCMDWSEWWFLLSRESIFLGKNHLWPLVTQNLPRNLFLMTPKTLICNMMCNDTIVQSDVTYCYTCTCSNNVVIWLTCIFMGWKNPTFICIG